MTEEHRQKIGESNRRRYRDNPETNARVRKALVSARQIRTNNAKYKNEPSKEGSRRRRYGLSASSFHVLWEKQQGKCGICSRQLEDRRGKIAVDHDHVTNAVRGLLCVPCNAHLGWFELHRLGALNYLDFCSKQDCP